MDVTPSLQGEQGGGDGGRRYGVLLYYKYAEVPDAAVLAAFFKAHCRALYLVGRVCPDGVNTMLGGRMAALEKPILTYCTGGIRCVMASAYIYSKGEGFGNVFQLYGGIQRYPEQFPDGGYLEGRNFVFDHRISVGSLEKSILNLFAMWFFF